jgi:hypothetical protein
MPRAPRTTPFSRGRCGLLLITLLLCTFSASGWRVSGARAQRSALELGHGRTALPAVDVVPVLIEERAHAIRAHASLGYGYTEDVLGADDAHHRTELDLALSYQLIEAVALAGRYGARLDVHDGAAGGDEGLATQAHLMARAGTPLGSMLRGGVEGGLRFPGGESGLTVSAISPEARAVLTAAPGAWWLSGSAGFRLDRAREGAHELERLSLADRVGLGASDANAVLFGLAAARSFGRLALLGEWSWDLQVGGRAADARQAPMRLMLGARLSLTNMLQAQLLAGVSPSARPVVAASGPLYPIEPRAWLSLGLGMRWGDEPREKPVPRAAPPPAPVKPAPLPLPPPPTTRTISGRVVDGQTRAPIAGAEIATADETVKVATDATGLFAFEGMPLGFIELRARADGFKEAVVPVGAGADQGADLEIELAPERTTALIRGTVSNFQGRAVAGHVLVQPGNVGAVLDADGSFEIEVPPGEYTVLIKASGYGLQQRHVDVERGDVAVIVVQLQAER